MVPKPNLNYYRHDTFLLEQGDEQGLHSGNHNHIFSTLSYAYQKPPKYLPSLSILLQEQSLSPHNIYLILYSIQMSSLDIHSIHLPYEQYFFANHLFWHVFWQNHIQMS